jgi:co-chaperonin GroES (HSP10)
VSGLSKERPKVLPFAKKSVAKRAAPASNIDISASSSQREPALSEEELRDAVSRIVLYGKFRETRHSAQDRSYRNVSERDILAMLEGKWSLAAKPDWDEEHRNWEYKVAGMDIDGDELVLKITVNVELQMIEIITKY